MTTEGSPDLVVTSTLSDAGDTADADVTDSEPSVNPAFIEKTVNDFLTDYQRPEVQHRYERLAKLTRDRCEQILQRNGIKGLVSSRGKKYASLETKLRDLKQDADFLRWIYERKDIAKYADMLELGGVRIGLYYPDDLDTVAGKLREEFDLVHTYGLVLGGRSPTQNADGPIPKEDKADFHAHTRKAPWAHTNSAGETDYYEHSGYKS